MKKIIIAIIFICISLTVASCGSNESAGNKSYANQNMTKHEIELTLDNYLSYFDVATSSYNNQSPYRFTGCLSYALYDNVSVCFEYTTSYSYGAPTKQTRVVKLDKSGTGSAPIKDGNTTVKLIDISGKVIYWI